MRDVILQTLQALNKAENDLAALTVESKIAAIDRTMAPEWEGWSNGIHSGNRQCERESETGLFGMIENYHRDFEKILVDPPLANVLWTMTGKITATGEEIRVPGSTTFEFDSNGKIVKSWVHFVAPGDKTTDGV